MILGRSLPSTEPQFPLINRGGPRAAPAISGVGVGKRTSRWGGCLAWIRTGVLGALAVPRKSDPLLGGARTAARGTGPLRVRDPGRWTGVGGRGPAAAHLPNVSAAVGVQQVYEHPLDPDNFLRPDDILFFGHGGSRSGSYGESVPLVAKAARSRPPDGRAKAAPRGRGLRRWAGRPWVGGATGSRAPWALPRPLCLQPGSHSALLRAGCPRAGRALFLFCSFIRKLWKHAPVSTWQRGLGGLQLLRNLIGRLSHRLGLPWNWS